MSICIISDYLNYAKTKVHYDLQHSYCQVNSNSEGGFSPLPDPPPRLLLFPPTRIRRCGIIPTCVGAIPRSVGIVPTCVRIIPTLVEICRNYSCTAKRCLTLCAMCRNFSYKLHQCGNISCKILQKFSINLYTCRNHVTYTSVNSFHHFTSKL